MKIDDYPPQEPLSPLGRGTTRGCSRPGRASKRRLHYGADAYQTLTVFPARSPAAMCSCSSTAAAGPTATRSGCPSWRRRSLRGASPSSAPAIGWRRSMCSRRPSTTAPTPSPGCCATSASMAAMRGASSSVATRPAATMRRCWPSPPRGAPSARCAATCCAAACRCRACTASAEQRAVGAAALSRAGAGRVGRDRGLAARAVRALRLPALPDHARRPRLSAPRAPSAADGARAARGRCDGGH